MTTRTSRFARTVRTLLGLVLTAGLLTVAACGEEAPRELAGTQRTPLPMVATETLPDVAHGGAPFEFVADEDEFLLVYFGYTHCPDVCPTTLADIRSALRTMDADEAARVDVAFATVDPDRDLDDLITGYVQSFFPGASALRTTDADQLRTVADVFGAVYDVDTTDDGHVEVIHSAFTYVVDDTGHLVVTWPFGVPAADIAADLDLLFDRQADEA